MNLSGRITDFTCLKHIQERNIHKVCSAIPFNIFIMTFKLAC